jgi:hypothetical protein
MRPPFWLWTTTLGWLLVAAMIAESALRGF